MTTDAASVQLADELGALAARLGAVLGTDIQLAITGRAADRSAAIVGEITEGDHPDETVADLLALLWPDDPPLHWWRTPLGLLCAPTAAREADAPGWSRAEAAEVLGVSTGTVAQLARRGTLEQVGGGALSRRSTLARMVRLNRERANR